MKKTGILFLVLIVALAGLGTGHGAWTGNLSVNSVAGTGNVGLQFTECELSDPLGSAYSISPDGKTLSVWVYNAYPEYQCMFDITVQNVGSVPMKITSTSLVYESNPGMLSLEGFWTDTNLIGLVMQPLETLSAGFWLYVTPQATQNAVYTFIIEIVGEEEQGAEPQPEDLGGTIGFWRNWDKHNTYTASQIDSWLQAINAESQWLVPDMNKDGIIEVSDMVAFLKAYNRASMANKFRAHYLATTLNIEAGRLSLDYTHDVTAYDPGNYLGLSDPSAAPLSEIVSRIESKYGTSPSNNQYEIMKDICDALNNLWI